METKRTRFGLRVYQRGPWEKGYDDGGIDQNTLDAGPGARGTRARRERKSPPSPAASDYTPPRSSAAGSTR